MNGKNEEENLSSVPNKIRFEFWPPESPEEEIQKAASSALSDEWDDDEEFFDCYEELSSDEQEAVPLSSPSTSRASSMEPEAVFSPVLSMASTSTSTVSSREVSPEPTTPLTSGTCSCHLSSNTTPTPTPNPTKDEKKQEQQHYWKKECDRLVGILEKVKEVDEKRVAWDKNRVEKEERMYNDNVGAVAVYAVKMWCLQNCPQDIRYLVDGIGNMNDYNWLLRFRSYYRAHAGAQNTSLLQLIDQIKERFRNQEFVGNQNRALRDLLMDEYLHLGDGSKASSGEFSKAVKSFVDSKTSPISLINTVLYGLNDEGEC
ncbi:hypothetical protein BT69DRAFT_286052 [Atractiella rhizophila]|nr:hypothetical protein BT69DRAFT_286052 [Atractiella rhizophila]